MFSIKRLICLFVGVLLAYSAFDARAATYAYRAGVFAYETPSSNATAVALRPSSEAPACTSFPNVDLDWADISFPAGFTFTYAGVKHSQFRVYSNGLIVFNRDIASNVGGVGGDCPSAGIKDAMIPYLLTAEVGDASVVTEMLTDGGTGQRRYVVTWDIVDPFNTRHSFQVVMHESMPGFNSDFKYQYAGGSSTGSMAMVGVQISDTDHTLHSINQNFIDTASGTAILWHPVAQGAKYRFDEGIWSGVSGEVKDSSGASLHANRIGSAASIADGKLCRGGSFTMVRTSLDAVDTPITPSNRGSVTFWYKPNIKGGTSDAILFDATTTSNQPFFLMKRSSGALRFSVTDSSDTVLMLDTPSGYTFNAQTWHHIAVTWSLMPGENQTVLRIMLDSTLVAELRATSDGAINSSLGTFSIGDNRTYGVTPSNGTTFGANGTIDEFNIYPLEITETEAALDMGATRASCSPLNHFHIRHTGTVVNCGDAVAAVTVEAVDSDHKPVTLSGVTMQMSTSTGSGTWSRLSTINPVTSGAGNGSGSYTFNGESTIVLGLSTTTSQALNINLSSGAVTEKSGTATPCTAADYTNGNVCDANLNFVDAGFLFNVPNHVAETSQNIRIQAVKKSDKTAACVPQLANQNKTLKFTCSYSNPTTGTLPVRVAGRALNAGNNASASCDGTGQSVSLPFNSSGVASTTVQYADVGSMILNASATLSDATISGSDGFVSAPKDFLISGITAGPIKAGAPFSATVTARNNAGVATPNFSRESPAEGVSLTFSKYQPTGSGSVNGTFSGSLGAFSDGVANGSAFSWSEVGTIDLTATLASGNYLSSGLTASGNTGMAGGVGRFIPHHFDTTITQGCAIGAFTYSGQPFKVTTTAKNLGGGVTLNYDGSANTQPNFARTTLLSNAGETTNLANNSTSVMAFAAGVGVNDAIKYTFPTPKTAPASLVLRAVDADGVSSVDGTQGTALIRSGRLNLANAYGSELLALPVAIAAQYWTGSYWHTNAADSCTTIPMSSLVMFNFTGGLAACETHITPAGAITLTGGVGSGVVLSKPGIGNSGSVDLTLNVGATASGSTCLSSTASAATAAALPWFGGNPKAKASFGRHKSPLIYMRENY